jgi:hypothetical protein
MMNVRLQLLSKLSATWIVAMLLIVSVATKTVGQAKEKMTVEKLVAKHLESIGTAKQLAMIKTRIITGTVRATFKNGTGKIQGNSVMASENNKSLIGMVFNSSAYPKDNVGFDGDSVSVSWLKPGSHSYLGNFLLAHNGIVKQGLLGGAISSSWALIDLAARKPSLQYGGIKKINNQQVHEIRYIPREGSDLDISLFFDSETFRHVRTEYKQIISAVMGSRPELSVQQRETRYKMVEEYSDFKPENGLTLPHTYKLSLSVTGPSNSLQSDWEFNFAQFMFNEPIDATSYNVALEQATK